LKIAHVYSFILKLPPPNSPPFPLKTKIKPFNRIAKAREFEKQSKGLKRKRKEKKFYLFTVHTQFNNVYLSIPFID
jgi:hypothetical protein